MTFNFWSLMYAFLENLYLIIKSQSSNRYWMTGMTQVQNEATAMKKKSFQQRLLQLQLFLHNRMHYLKLSFETVLHGCNCGVCGISFSFCCFWHSMYDCSSSHTYLILNSVLILVSVLSSWLLQLNLFSVTWQRYE